MSYKFTKKSIFIQLNKKEEQATRLALHLIPFLARWRQSGNFSNH